jgi:hypothetical protein
MSTLTSLVKSGKAKIKTKKEEPAKREQKSVEARQKRPKSTGVRASIRSFLGRPDEKTSREFLGRPDQETSRSFLGRPDEKTSREFLGRPDPDASDDPTRP